MAFELPPLPFSTTALEPHSSQHHLGVSNEILVDGDRPVLCFDCGKILPGFCVRERGRRPLLQKENVGRDSRSRVRFESCVGEPDCPDEVGALGEMPPDRRILLVHRVAAGDERQHSAGANLVQRLRQEIIVNGASESGRAAVGGIEDRVIAERNIADDRVEEIVRKRRIFEAFGEDGRVRIKAFCNSGGD